jgi:hypothetical protein
MKDYTRFSSRRTEVRVKEDPTSEVETVEIVEQTAIEVEPEVEQEVITPKQGVVTDCIRLNVRKEPSRKAEVVCEITADTNLVIYEDESTEDFYKVCTFSGIEGYCMKRYVSLLP